MNQCKRCSFTYECHECPKCRRLERAEKSDKPYGICKECDQIQVLEENGDCRPCLKQKGLRVCKSCHEAKSETLSFWKNQSTCSDCIKPRKRVKPIEFTEMLEKQNGRCKICLDPQPSVHDKKRECMLCIKCSNTLKHLTKDNLKRLNEYVNQ